MQPNDQTIISFFKEVFNKLEDTQKEVANLVREIHTDVAVLKERQHRTDKIWDSFEERFEYIETNVNKIEHRLELVEKEQSEIEQTSSFWRDLFTTKAFDLLVTATLLVGGFVLGHFVEIKPNPELPEVINGR